MLATRASELELAISERAVADVALEVITRELASHLAMAEAFDAAIAQGGVLNRRGEPKTLIATRLRIGTRIPRLLDQLTALDAQARTTTTATADAELAASRDEEQPPEPLHAWIARSHFRNSVVDISPEEFDPDLFLRAIITCDDPAITRADRKRGRRLLTQLESERYEFCTCRATPAAQDEYEMRDWITDFRERDGRPDQKIEKLDAVLAAQVRRLANGDELDEPAPYYYERRKEAVADAVERLAHSAHIDPASQAKRQQNTRSKEPTVRRSWVELLAADDAVTPKVRLDAFVELRELDVLPQCICKPPRNVHLDEVRYDEQDAHIIRLVAHNTRAAARYIAAFPKTACAVQDAADRAILEHTEELRANRNRASVTSTVLTPEA